MNPTNQQGGSTMQRRTRNVQRVVIATFTLLAGTAAAVHAADKDDMVLVPFGEFTMGAGLEGDDDAHQVVLSSFYIDKYEVSNTRYQQFVAATGHAPSAYSDDRRLNLPNHPVVGVNWYDAKAFCAWDGKRLPTEAEWEKAAKGPSGNLYPWGNAFNDKNANCCNINDSTMPVDSHPEGASEYGAYHMAGNAYEWVQDWYDHQSYKTSKTVLNPQGPKKGLNWGALGEMKVIRGGSWFAPSGSLTTTHRFWNQPENNSYGIGLGFRCAKDADNRFDQTSRAAYNQALIKFATENYAGALAAIDEALKLEPGNRGYLELKMEVTKKVASSKQK
jgi:formylglycine-generating enzyme required for sulfatase activity